jgi:hypothetical protein
MDRHAINVDRPGVHLVNHNGTLLEVAPTQLEAVWQWQSLFASLS